MPGQSGLKQEVSVSAELRGICRRSGDGFRVVIRRITRSAVRRQGIPEGAFLLLYMLPEGLKEADFQAFDWEQNT
jgi:hypothetical protein